MNFLRFGGKIPNMSPADVSGSCVYNPWPHLPETLNSTKANGLLSSLLVILLNMALGKSLS
jgi:hypothetical protein